MVKEHKKTFLALMALLLISPSCQAGNQVCVKSHCFNVELAQTRDEMIKGLQFRQELDKDSGMLFIFPQSYKMSFWMKDTLIPLDIIWLNYEKKIVHIAKSVQPCRVNPCPSYAPANNAMYVLEINSGLSEQYDFNVGDRVDFKINLEKK